MNLLKATLAAVFLCIAMPATTVLAAVPAQTVLLVGDSLSSAHRVPVASGWVSLLTRRLQASAATPPTIVNASRGGKTMADAIAELPGLLARHHPQAVILELGGNDAILGATETQLSHDLSRLIDMAHDAGARVAVLGFEIPPKLDHDRCAARLRGVYRQVAHDKGVVLLPSLMAGVSNQPALLLDDGVHPTATAQARLLDNAWSTLKPFLLD
ncbi:GDSL-type esterase/lipase family protein [Frateuria hangzhouensis]|uniref:GDSL-type esterase/lipase family protein n=1 Tax=Frateuria hangzhouensis TaxID=2995589 RepID=UPI002260F54E|nr:GDSL-type esterase/lipase family protein [Frateuria sp. STR12]MCX7514802.1 GDSL-type esterase/lipase family protein [Frateuria sp. STR12]